MTENDDVAELFGAWCARRAEDSSLEPEELIGAHPELADELRKRFDALAFVDVALAQGHVDVDGTPERIGEYRIVRELGRGGMGVVFEAEQDSMRRRVALKVLSLAITSSPQAVRRFQREARSAGRLHHTNIVPVYGMGQHERHWYYAMELVPGRPLSEVIRAMRGDESGPDETAYASLPSSSPLRADVGSPAAAAPTPGDAPAPGDRAYYSHLAGMFAGVADALHVAHLEGIVHRDVKPANLMLADDGRLRIVDFGLAHVRDGDVDMTLTGHILGTPAYMSPEQTLLESIGIDHRTDIYSLGATLYEVLTLTRAFAGHTTDQICRKIMLEAPPAPRRANRRIPRDLETIVQKAMRKDRARRYHSAHDLARDLERFAAGERIHARRPGMLERARRWLRRRRTRRGAGAWRP